MSQYQKSIGRRDFLRGASGLCATLATTPLLAAESEQAGKPPTEDLTSLSATELSRAIRERSVSCVEVMRAYLDRINRLNPTYNALVSLRDEEDLLLEAQGADRGSMARL